MPRKKILVIDDSRIILKTLSLKLTANGYDVATAVDGSEAITAVKRDKPDLLLVDISFPLDVGHGGGVPWDGFLIMNWLRRMDEAKDIPFIVITGGDPSKLKDQALKAGAVSFFHKPIENDELLATIRQVLGEPAPQEPAPAA